MMRCPIIATAVVCALLLPTRAPAQQTAELRENPPAERSRTIGVFLEAPDESRDLRLFSGVYYQWKRRRWLDLRAGLYYSGLHGSRYYGTQWYGHDTFIQSTQQLSTRIGGLMVGMESRRAFWRNAYVLAGLDARLGIGRSRNNVQSEYLRYDASQPQPGLNVVQRSDYYSKALLFQWNVRPYVGARMIWSRVSAGIDFGLSLDQTIDLVMEQSSGLNNSGNINFNLGFPSWRLMAGWRI